MSIPSLADVWKISKNWKVCQVLKACICIGSWNNLSSSWGKRFISLRGIFMVGKKRYIFN